MGFTFHRFSRCRRRRKARMGLPVCGFFGLMTWWPDDRFTRKNVFQNMKFVAYLLPMFAYFLFLPWKEPCQQAMAYNGMIFFSVTSKRASPRSLAEPVIFICLIEILGLTWIYYNILQSFAFALPGDEFGRTAPSDESSNSGLTL